MRRETSLRAMQRKLYERARLVFLALHPRCEKCGAPATEVHHMAGREGWLLVWLKHFMAVCRRCHRWITDNGKAAAAQGWKYEVQITTPEQRVQIESEAREYVALKGIKPYAEIVFDNADDAGGLRKPKAIPARRDHRDDALR